MKKQNNWVKNEKEFYKIVYLISITLIINALLNSFFLDSTLGASLFIGYCFFIAVISFNKKALKGEKSKEKQNSGE